VTSIAAYPVHPVGIPSKDALIIILLRIPFAYPWMKRYENFWGEINSGKENCK